MLARVSHIESFRQWQQDEDASTEDLIHRLTAGIDPDAMRAGRAFHKALETAPYGQHDTLHADGYVFQFPQDSTLILPTVRELRGSKAYGPLTVTGCVDAINGRSIDDHKSTGRFDPERYLTGFQWRLYLDMFEADTFRWNVFEIDEVKPRIYSVADPQVLTQYRYPRMHEECARLAADFYEFARVHLPGGPLVQL
jgi:hypothetical protein